MQTDYQTLCQLLWFLAGIIAGALLVLLACIAFVLRARFKQHSAAARLRYNMTGYLPDRLRKENPITLP